MSRCVLRHQRGSPKQEPAAAGLIFTQLLTVNTRPCHDIKSISTRANQNSQRGYDPWQHQYQQQSEDYSAVVRQQQQQQQQQHTQQQQRMQQVLSQFQQYATTRTDSKGPTSLDRTLAVSGNFSDQQQKCRSLIKTAEEIKKNVHEMNNTRIKQAREHMATAQRVHDLATTQLTTVIQESKWDTQICEQNVVAAKSIDQQTKRRIDNFRSNAEKKLQGLSCSEAHEVLLLLGVTTQVNVLEQQGIDGDALADLMETDMHNVLGMGTLGSRRRLRTDIQNLANNKGFPKPRKDQPGALGWDVAEVLVWLQKEGLQRSVHYFKQQDIDGPCLLQLTPEDLSQLGVSTVGERSMFRRKLESLKKHTYAGQFVASTDNTATPNSTHTMEAVLQAVLEQNRELLQRVETVGANPAIPPQCLCPILHAVMHDPVIALDGHTYDRAAIAAWFDKSNRSPMTNMEIEPILIPNISVRQLIATLPGQK